MSHAVSRVPRGALDTTPPAFGISKLFCHPYARLRADRSTRSVLLDTANLSVLRLAANFPRLRAPTCGAVAIAPTHVGRVDRRAFFPAHKHFVPRAQAAMSHAVSRAASRRPLHKTLPAFGARRSCTVVRYASAACEPPGARVAGPHRAGDISPRSERRNISMSAREGLPLRPVGRFR